MTAVAAYRIRIAPGFAAWREQARQLLRDGIAPEAVEIADEEDDRTLALDFAAEYPRNASLAVGRPVVPNAFLDLAEIVSCHRDRGRWQLLYRILWRLQRRRDLMRDELDEDIARMHRMGHQVRRDLHKMHAFLRFRMVPENGHEHYVAWYRPDHLILPLAAPFFMERFAVMRWTIMTADATAEWEPETRKLTWGPGVSREAAPLEDEIEGMWRTYYGYIFNPARLNPRAMRAEMPTRYWQNLPELAILPRLLDEAGSRVAMMIDMQKQLAANTFVPENHVLSVLAEALPSCQGCSLYQGATQAVFGHGNAHVGMMLVGEQPGDAEDLAGEPFVGPAGQLLNEVLRELGMDRAQMYVTNAVKHFKFVERGKRRIHESPSLREVAACRPWLLAELDAVQPKVVVALGATAARALLGAKFALMKERGRVVESPYARQVVATLHPSALLRAQDDVKEQLYSYLKQDLHYAATLAKAAGSAA